MLKLWRGIQVITENYYKTVHFTKNFIFIFGPACHVIRLRQRHFTWRATSSTHHHHTIHKVVDDGGSKQRPLGAVHLGPFQSPISHSPISEKFPDPAGPFPYLQIQFDFYNLKYHPSSFSNLPNLRPNDNSSLSWTHCQIEATFPSHFYNFMEAH